MTKNTMRGDAWTYRGVRALVILHQRELLRFIERWKAAKARGVSLAGTTYESGMTLETLVVHVLHWARDYLVWSCENLRLPDPTCPPIPAPGDVARELDTYVEHLLACWKEPFRALPEDVFYEPQYRTRWGHHYPVEALLEHAVVHPMRHRLQLEELMEGGGRYDRRVLPTTDASRPPRRGPGTKGGCERINGHRFHAGPNAGRRSRPDSFCLCRHAPIDPGLANTRRALLPG
jgi:hypothetical protein